MSDPVEPAIAYTVALAGLSSAGGIGSALPWLIMLLVFSSLLLCTPVLRAVFEWLWIHRVEPWVMRTDLHLQSLFLFTRVRRWLPLYLLMLVLTPLGTGLYFSSVVFAGLLFILLAALPRWVIATLVRRRRADITRALPAVLLQIAGAMRAGSTFTTAVRDIAAEHRGPLAQELSLFLREQRMGTPVADALQHLAHRIDTEEVELFVAATVVARSLGGNLAEILQRLAEDLRDRIELETRIRTLTAQGVLQGRVVSLLPMLVLGALLCLEPQAIWPIFTSLLGWGFLAVILALQALGALAIRRLVNIRI